MADSTSPRHVAVAVVLQVTEGRLSVLLDGTRLPGGRLARGETLDACVRRYVEADALAHLEQLETRLLSNGTLATVYLGLVRSDVELAADWSPATSLRVLGGDDASILAAAMARLRAKLSYTNVGFALAPATFTISELRQIYVAALGHDVSATNLQRVLVRRRLLEPTGEQREPGRAGGRPAAVFRFSSRKIEITDQFGFLKPPGL